MPVDIPSLPAQGSIAWYTHYAGLDAAARELQIDVASLPVFEILTQTEYDALTAAGQVSATTIYLIRPAGFEWMISDNFAATENPPATTDTGQTWRVEAGTWNQAAGGITATADGAIILAPVGSNTQTMEYVLGGTVATTSIPTAVLRYDNSNDYHYRIEKVNTSELRIARRDPTQTVIWQSPVGALPGTGAKVRVSVTGAPGATVFRVWVNDTEITTSASGSLTDTDSTPPLGTEAGFRYSYTSTGNGYRYQNFRAHNAVVVP